MPALYVTEPGAVVRRSVGSIVVTLDEDPDGAGPLPRRRRCLIEVEPHRLDLVALFGHVHITSDATQFCLREGIDLAWLTRGGRLLGRVVPELPRSGEVRLAQYRRTGDCDGRFALARKIVEAKVRNGIEVLRGLQSNRPNHPDLASAIAEVRRAADRLAEADTFETLLGMEGVAARHYFTGLGSGFTSDIVFRGRVRRPPPDPANALLSLAYVMLGNMLSGLVEARGLDPCIGFYHELRPGRPSLALDLVEELRAPVVDRFVLRLCNLRIVRPEMFTDDPEEGSVRLTQAGLKIFLAEWQKNLDRSVKERGAEVPLTVHQIMRRQVGRISSDLRGGDAYEPLRISR